ncbi:hypothetical protein ACIU1J_17105 [Azospirillum doebereinerae]|uniref:hypothetical protein n=1 Tax=Azospirillum doebereinerae TaxID=92933 RepID=UPI003850B2C8
MPSPLPPSWEPSPSPPPGFAFDVQSGGVPLSAQSVAMLANRLAARAERASMDATGPTATGPATGTPNATLTRDERMMRFMLGGQNGGRSNGAADGLTDAKTALRKR